MDSWQNGIAAASKTVKPLSKAFSVQIRDYPPNLESCQSLVYCNVLERRWAFQKGPGSSNLLDSANFIMRNSNTFCTVCNTPIYRRPSEIKKASNVFCSRECYRITTPKKKYICKFCNLEFVSKYDGGGKHIYCSRICANHGRAGSKYPGKGLPNDSQRKLFLLKQKFKFDSCMVIGCNYNVTYDIDRLIPGKNGGKYEIGNMFAVCPNHHAEKTRGTADFIKINDYTLDIKYK